MNVFLSAINTAEHISLSLFLTCLYKVRTSDITPAPVYAYVSFSKPLNRHHPWGSTERTVSWILILSLSVSYNFIWRSNISFVFHNGSCCKKLVLYTLLPNSCVFFLISKFYLIVYRFGEYLKTYKHTISSCVVLWSFICLEMAVMFVLFIINELLKRLLVAHS
jgi:hypothetical protein